MNNFLIKFFATGLGVGYIPKAPGTFATLFAAAIWWYLPTTTFYIVSFFIFIIAFLVCGKAEKLSGVKDDQRIVIDELAGYFIAVASLPKTFFVLISSIILFRFFDIKKPFFIKSVQKLKGSMGIITDDLLSGITTNLILQLIIRIFNF
ncbi:MAG: phosphatidylglycerophosphatase A [Elusimicrobia bacterium]|nr:phosphatidylglycerophosphatase A [Elusimicrobiota bacterium]